MPILGWFYETTEAAYLGFDSDWVDIQPPAETYVSRHDAPTSSDSYVFQALGDDPDEIVVTGDYYPFGKEPNVHAPMALRTDDGVVNEFNLACRAFKGKTGVLRIGDSTYDSLMYLSRVVFDSTDDYKQSPTGDFKHAAIKRPFSLTFVATEKKSIPIKVETEDEG